ncbi:hypothetical protein [Catellatospora methionotrophica]|uniref:hypothetical protein n=1 Tax=Catellatospora methionotrophica TaxID=121620 RepID=UPI0033C54A01
MNTIVATDLDGTVIFSPRTGGDGADLISVDEYRGRSCGAMTAQGHRAWERLAGTGALVPVTTRTSAQYQRIRLPGPAPRLALVCNGARLLVDGDPDPAWDRRVRRATAASAAPFETVWAHVASWAQAHPFTDVKSAEDFFVYAVAAAPAPWLAAVAAEAGRWAEPRGWRVSLQGRKLYLVPTVLDKAWAVAGVAERLAADRVVAGGDSLLDEGMLLAADRAVRPAHGELHTAGFRAPHCHTTATSGAAAGAEISHWYLSQLDDGKHSHPKEMT